MKLTKQRIFEIIKEEITASRGMSEVLLQEEPSLKNALAGVRRDYNQMVIKDGQPMSFVAKYKDEKKWYSGFDSLSPEEQDNYKQDIQTRLKSIEDSAESEPEASQEPEQQPEKPQELPSGDKVALDELPELQQAFRLFSDDDSGFMQVPYLREQDKMIGDLRSALRKFLGIEGQERALKEQDESPSQTGDKNSDARKKLIKSVTRYRRDLNDAGKLLADYLGAAQAGQVKARLFLNKLKEEMQQIQNHNMFIVRDLLQIAGINESLVLEEESREEIVAKVESAYDAIVIGLKPALEIETRGEQNVQQTAEEIQSIVGAAEDALNQVDSIKQYFRVTGTFNKPLGELKDDFLDYVAGYKKTMSDLVVDLKQGTPSPEEANRYAANFAKLADKIQEDFGVSPANPIKVPGLPVVQSAEDASDDNTAAINPAPSPEVTPELEDRPEPEADSGPRPDDITDISVLTNFMFDNNSDYFKPSEMDRIFGKENADAFRGIRRLLLALLYNKILQDRDEASADVPIDSGPLQEQEETDRQRLARLGQDAGYKPIVIQRFLNSIDGKNYRSKGRDGIETISYNDMLNAITTLNDTKLKQIFNKLRQVEDDLKKADVAFDVDSSKIKQKIKSLMVSTSAKTKGLDESRQNNNLIMRLIKQELKVLNGKKMVRN